MLDLLNEINKIWWWHSIDLGNGIITPGHSDTKSQLTYLKIPDNLEGKTVLDIGAWDGFYSFLAEERGAIVTATDDYEHSWGKCASGKTGFDLAKKARNSKVSEFPSSINDLSVDNVGQFDIVFFFGVLYHIKDPYRSLEIVCDLTKEMAIIETFSKNNNTESPLMEFYHNESPDPSNYFAPNMACLTEMLKAVGFRRIVPTIDYPKIPDGIRVAVYGFKE